jgi:hypothetical protein
LADERQEAGGDCPGKAGPDALAALALGENGRIGHVGAADVGTDVDQALSWPPDAKARKDLDAVGSIALLGKRGAYLDGTTHGERVISPTHLILPGGRPK